jgi:hypothetical protein
VGITCYSDYGPYFGRNGACELGAYEPFNGDKKCVSWANDFGHKIVIKGGKNMLTNNNDGMFTISEIEVWKVVNVENLELKGKKK